MNTSIFNSFWKWYEKHLLFNTSVAAGLFLIQLVHLFWLTTNVVLYKLTGNIYFEFKGIWEVLIILVDYTEIPAIITTTLLYIHEFKKGKKFRAILYLVLLNSQWIHIFWITDEYVIEQLTGQATLNIASWLAWIAIAIDYLELPVIYDTVKKLVTTRNLQVLKDS